MNKTSLPVTYFKFCGNLKPIKGKKLGGFFNKSKTN